MTGSADGPASSGARSTLAAVRSVRETAPKGRLRPSLYLLLAERCGAADCGRTVKTQTIETSDESASPIEPLAGGRS